MTKDIALRSDFPVNITEQMQTAKALAQAGVLPGHLRQQPANIMAIGMAARALDVPTWTALQQVVPIDGKVTIQADLMRALVLRAGHKFRVEAASPQQATVVVIRSDDPDFEHRVTVTYAEIPDELKKKKNWQNYTADMLVARATAKVCRRSCSDVLNGMIYTPDELGAEVDDDGQVVQLHREGTPQAQKAADAAERLRAAADAEASRNAPQEPNQPQQATPAADAPATDDGVNADGTVDAEVVEDGHDDQHAAAPEQTADQADEFPESQGEPFGQSTDDADDLSEAANRPVVRVTALRRSLLAEAEKRWGGDYADAVKVACEGVPLEKVTNDELRELLFGKAS